MSALFLLPKKWIVIWILFDALMEIFLHKNFVRKYAKLRQGEKEKFKERRNLFLQDPFNPLLNNHALTGKYSGSRSVNVTGDLRAVFDIVGKNSILFIDIDTHSNLYKE